MLAGEVILKCGMPGTVGGRSEHALHVGQVGVQVNPIQSSVVGFNNPVFQQVVKNAAPPKFTGRGQDWAFFVQDWERYLRKLAVCVPNLTNQMKLELWEGVLDETSLKFFRMRQREMGDRMSYTEEFAKMNVKFSRDQNIGARRRWEEVFIFNAGKVTSREWRDFEANFISAWQEVEGASPDEARRLLLQKIPNFILKWVTEEEERRTFTNPTIRMNVPMEMTEEGVSNSIIVRIGKKPTMVKKLPKGEFEIVLPDFADTEKMLSFNGKSFKDSSVIVKVVRVESVLDVEDIFLFVAQKLALRDRQDLLQTVNQHSGFGKQKARSINVEEPNKGGNSKKKSKEGNRASTSSPEHRGTAQDTPSSQSAPTSPVGKNQPSTPVKPSQPSIPQPSVGGGGPSVVTGGRGQPSEGGGWFPVNRGGWNGGRGKGSQPQWQNSQWNGRNQWNGSNGFWNGWNSGWQPPRWNPPQNEGKGKGKGAQGKGRGKGGGRG